jgi:hypothetical protein
MNSIFHHIVTEVDLCAPNLDARKAVMDVDRGLCVVAAADTLLSDVIVNWKAQAETGSTLVGSGV